MTDKLPHCDTCQCSEPRCMFIVDGTPCLETASILWHHHDASCRHKKSKHKPDAQCHPFTVEEK